jgi:hypothetical protein
MPTTTYLWDSDLKRNLPRASYESWNPLHRAYMFFKQEGYFGGIVGEKAKMAFLFAKAEQWADDHGLVSLTDYDSEQAYCYCDSETCKYHEGSDHTWDTVVALLVKPCEEYDTDESRPHMTHCSSTGCDLSCPHTEVLASVGGIMEPTSLNYLRTIHANLALEAMEASK